MAFADFLASVIAFTPKLTFAAAFKAIKVIKYAKKNAPNQADNFANFSVMLLSKIQLFGSFAGSDLQAISLSFYQPSLLFQFYTIHSLASLAIIWYCYLQDFGESPFSPRNCTSLQDPVLSQELYFPPKKYELENIQNGCHYCKQAEEYTIHGIFCIVSNLLGYYFWRVVWSAYKEIKAENVNFVKSVPYPKSERTKLIGQDIKMITYRTPPNPDPRVGGSNLNLDEEAVNRSTETGISIIFNAFDPPKAALPINQV